MRKSYAVIMQDVYGNRWYRAHDIGADTWSARPTAVSDNFRVARRIARSSRHAMGDSGVRLIVQAVDAGCTHAAVSQAKGSN